MRPDTLSESDSDKPVDNASFEARYLVSGGGHVGGDQGCTDRDKATKCCHQGRTRLPVLLRPVLLDHLKQLVVLHSIALPFTRVSNQLMRQAQPWQSWASLPYSRTALCLSLLALQTVICGAHQPCQSHQTMDQEVVEMMECGQTPDVISVVRDGFLVSLDSANCNLVGRIDRESYAHRSMAGWLR